MDPRPSTVPAVSSDEEKSSLWTLWVATVSTIALALGAFVTGSSTRAQAIHDWGSPGPLVSSGYVENVEDITCTDAGTVIEASNGQYAIDCACSADVYWGNESVIPTTGKADSDFNGRVKSVKCRHGPGTATCDCRALVSTEPD